MSIIWKIKNKVGREKERKFISSHVRSSSKQKAPTTLRFFSFQLSRHTYETQAPLSRRERGYAGTSRPDGGRPWSH